MWQGFEYERVTQSSKYANIWLNMSEYERVTQSSKYATIWLNMSEWDMNMPEYI